jgi:hypothetical protein
MKSPFNRTDELRAGSGDIRVTRIGRQFVCCFELQRRQPMKSTKTAIVTLAAAVAVVMFAAPAGAGGSIVTRGDIAPFAAGAGLGYGDITGSAQMIRTASGTTIVSVQVSGLVAGSTYGSHVHKQACADGDAGGHYSFGFAVPGGALDGSEIWPGPMLANPAGRAAGWTMVGATAGPSASSVVIHGPTGAKIACADLS